MLGHTTTDIDDITSSPNFEITSTLTYSHGLPPNPVHTSSPQQCYLLDYAVDRLLLAAKELKWSRVVSSLTQPNVSDILLREIENHIHWEHADASDPEYLFIVRIAFKKNGQVTLMSGQRPHVTAIPLYPTQFPAPNKKSSKQIPIIPVYVDDRFMVPSQITRHKTNYRAPYSEARARVGLHPTTPFIQGEVLLVNTEGEVMDGGFTTIYFWRQDEGGNWGWRTPRQESGTKLGVTRRWALENAGVTEMAIMAKDVMDGEKVWLSSAGGGFVRGRITFERHLADSSASDGGL
ncbi:aminodeoxychorismate lyase [Pochonia chlamydosporia 170]|uniref:Aminodeoxychorismate lyase n=1 Tax=Pochonia chlamydosporia 170 TaxID=1380566 RepID=A0A179G8T1_METCM|nr:aminodeoxychorismate lyase [Pochonia chlamydosporia 170]OAQ74217.1 aminodeoxychorismate lyase [Pochonia chlamydosporia 170]